MYCFPKTFLCIACGNNPCLLGNACPSGNNKYSANNTSCKIVITVIKIK